VRKQVTGKLIIAWWLECVESHDDLTLRNLCKLGR